MSFHIYDLFDLPLPNIGETAAAGLQHARDILGMAVGRWFYTPQQLVMFLTVEREKRDTFVRWLRIVELMIRRTLFLEASAIAKDLPLPKSRAAKKREPRPPEPYSETPEDWRCSFSIMPRGPRGPRPSRTLSEREPPWEFVPARPIARRLEAILRVVKDPQRYIHRLALRLRRGLQRYRGLIAPFHSFYSVARSTLDDLEAEIAPRFTDSS